MSEKVLLTVAETKPSNVDYRIERLTLDVGAGVVYVQLLGTNNEAKGKIYDSSTTPTGASLIIALNKANLTIKSLQRRIYEQLIADGVIAGSITGTPD